MNTVDAKKFKQMLVAGANRLEAEKKIVDEMNVFPVPDGDTGTNMSLTVTSAVREVMAVESDSVVDVAKALSSGALRGARGNSGVIVSQLFRGLYKGLKGTDGLNAITLAAAMQRGMETAYKAVMKPKEGTILTVAKAAAQAAGEASLTSDDMAYVVEQALSSAEETLAKTPDMLPVLKEAGVVDAGGKGLTLILRGFLESLRREDSEIDEIMALKSDSEKEEAAQAAEQAQYCVEYVAADFANAKDFAAELEKKLNEIGESVIVAVEGSEVKAHLHTKNPGAALEAVTSKGALMNVKVENKAVSHHHVLGLQNAQKKAEEPRKEVGFVTISVGEGLKNLFTELGVDYILSGGQTMNPSTDDILHAAAQVNADNVVVFPNNKNIILAAQQAALLSKDQKIYVVPTKSIPQGIAAMIGYVAGESMDYNMQEMTNAMNAVTSGSVTYAVRDTHMGEFDIHDGNILAMKNGEMNQVGEDLMETTKKLISEMITDETGLFTIYFGQESSEAQANELSAYIQENYPSVEVDIQEGDQPIYYFLLSAE